MRKTKRIISLLLVMLFSIGIFTACGKKTSSNTLRFLDVTPNAARQKYFEDIFEEFKGETGITIVYESVPWDDAANRIAVMGAANDLPDVMTTWTGWLGQYTDSEWVLPLDDYIGDTKSNYSDLVNNIIWKGENDLYGATYTVPDGVMVKGVYVRSDWAKEAGLNLDPKKGWTYDEYFDAVFAMTDASKNRYGTSFRGARGGFDPILVYMEGFYGGKIYADDGTTLINDQEGIDAFKKWCTVYQEGAAPKDSINWGFSEMVDNFTGGLTATLINDSEIAPVCLENMEEGTWMIMPMPTHPDGNIYNTINSPYGYSISSNTSNADNAWKLIQFLSTAENNAAYCKLNGSIPVYKNLTETADYGPGGLYETFVDEINSPNMVAPVSYGPFDYTDLHQGMFHEELQKYLLGQIDAETAVNTIAGELQTRMQKYLETNPDYKIEQPKYVSQ